MLESRYYLYMELIDSDSSALLVLSMQQVSTQANFRPRAFPSSHVFWILTKPALSFAWLSCWKSWNVTSPLRQVCERIAYCGAVSGPVNTRVHDVDQHSINIHIT